MDQKTIVDKRTRGTYKINPNISPQENINEILKITMPIKLTLNKLQSGQTASGNLSGEKFRMDGVSIIAVGYNRWTDCNDINEFRRIRFEMRIPGRNWGRESQRNWTVGLQNRRNGEKRVSLSHVTNVFNELSNLYQEGKEIEDKRLEEEQLAKKRLEDLRSRSRLPQEISLRQTTPAKDSYYISLSLDNLTEEQVIALSPVLIEALDMKKG
tara:strand:- start:2241 stop:2876 length:636 start_codon:yes stop_codon:yes gene_type:complete